VQPGGAGGTTERMFTRIALLALLTSAAPIDSSHIELVESAPIETTLDHDDVRNASVVWLEMIEHAKTSLDLAQFYVSDRAGGPLSPIIEAIEKSAQRGVRVRFLADAKFHKTYPEILDRLGKVKNIEMRLYDMKPLTGGVLHAKYFVVDGTSGYLGSQNFDWRSLEHIQELGARIDDAGLAASLGDVFDLDWAIAGGEPRPTPHAADRTSIENANTPNASRTTLVGSPKELLPETVPWDLPRIVALIDEAKTSVRVQVLTYKMAGTNEYFPDLENALRRAAARKVSVQLLVADWCMRKGTIEGLQSLEPLANIEVKLVTIPQWSGGYVPFARVVHSKYLVVDGKNAWLGTNNWEKGYFYESRNVGLILEGGAIPKRMDGLFSDLWNSTYATAVDPCAKYTPPKTGE
jgi:phosphatidylserine/phosphatidylglycerophosphate/cardiolipin synthase-like enzyme